MANARHPESPPGLVWYSPLLSLIPFRWVASPLLTGVVEPYLVQGVWVLSHFAAGENRLYPDYWVITGDPRYLRYKTPTKRLCIQLTSDEWMHSYRNKTNHNTLILKKRY
jgi:hypothetical protein